MKIRNPTLFLSLGIVALMAMQFVYFDKKLHSHRKRTFREFKICKRMMGVIPHHLRIEGYKIQFPKELAYIPQRNEAVVDVKKIEIRNVEAPYNASVVETENGYLIFFRYDLVKQMHLRLYHSHIGCAELDKDFKQTDKEFITINTNSTFSEDPRVVQLNGNFSLIYNDLVPSKFYSRTLHLANIDFENQQATNVEKINVYLGHVEKNWAPFVYQDAVHFEYQLFKPRRILKYSSNKNHEWIDNNIPRELDDWHTKWTKKWGQPLGGTNAQLVDGEYLSFFHSKFLDDNGHTWYVMGAYTFETKPPFRITATSVHPILFDGAYESPSLNTAQPNKFVIFPCGFAVKKQEDKTLIHLGCGENDSVIKVITLDKDILMKGMQKIENVESTL